MDKIDLISITKDISDRSQIVQNYYSTGILDRANAIKMIQQLRLTDPDVAEVTAAKLAISSTPFSEVSDQDIVNELQMQVDVLLAKLRSRD